MTRLLSVLYLAAGIAPRAASFALILVLTRLMPPAEYGLVVLVVATGETLDMVLSGWTRIFSLRAEAGRRLTSLRLGRVLTLAGGAALCTIVAGALLASALDPGHAGDVVPGVVLYAAAFALLRLTLTLLQLRGRHAAYLAVEIGRGLLGFAGALGGALLLDGSIRAIAFGLAGGTGLAAAIGFAVALRGLPRPRLPRAGYRPALRFALPIVVGMAAVYGLGLFDRYLLTFLQGSAAVAVYAAAYAIARQPIDLVAGSINSITFPVLMRRYGEAGPTDAATAQAGILVSIVAVVCGLAAGLAALAEPIATLLLPAPYHADAAAIVPWIALGSALHAIKNYVFDNAFHATDRNWLQLGFYLPAAGIGIVAGALLIAAYGVQGAAMGFAAASVAALGLSAYAAQRVMPMRLPLLRFAAIGLSAVVAAVAARGAIVLLPHDAAGELALGGALAGGVYLIGLTLGGLSVPRLLQTPWAPIAEGRAS